MIFSGDELGLFGAPNPELQLFRDCDLKSAAPVQVRHYDVPSEGEKFKQLFLRWMAGLAKGNGKDQTRMIVKTVEGVMAENARRAKANKAPLTFDEALAETKRVLSVELQVQGSVDRDLFSGDGYGPGCNG